MTTFLRYLSRQLDRESPGWQEKSTILLDNAAWHVNSVMKSRLSRLRLPIIYSGPYSYTSAPAEQVFAALKFGDLNPMRLPTGKKSLTNIVEMVESRLSEIPQSVRVRYWHHAVLGLYSYLYFERLWVKTFHTWHFNPLALLVFFIYNPILFAAIITESG